MLKSLSQLEVKIENKDYRFLCEPDSSISHVKEALFQFLKYAGAVEDAIKMQQENMAIEAATKEKEKEKEKSAEIIKE